MNDPVNRRNFLAASAVAAGTLLSQTSQSVAADLPAGAVRIVGISTSPRKGKTTTGAVKAALDAAGKTAIAIETELIELADYDIPVFTPGGAKGDFDKLVPMLTDSKVGGIIIGSPVYFCSLCSMCKAFLDHCSAFRMGGFKWANKVGGALAVGGVRNGGQELTIQCIQAVMMCHEMVVVGDGRPTAHTGATLVNPGDDQIAADTFGMTTAKNLGQRVAQTALLLAASKP